MDALGFFLGLSFSLVFAIYGFREFPSATFLRIFNISTVAIIFDLISTIILRDLLGYGWANEINISVKKWGAVYGESFVLICNHAVLIGISGFLAMLCVRFSFLRFFYILIVFSFCIQLWLFSGWNIAQALAISVDSVICFF